MFNKKIYHLCPMSKQTVFISQDDHHSILIAEKKDKFFVFDLDETLYSVGNPLAIHIDTQPLELLKRHSHIIDPLETKKQYFEKYGLACKGFFKDGLITPEEYDGYFVSAKYESWLKGEWDVKSLMDKIPYKKAVFSNSPKNHIVWSLEAMGLQDYFDYVVYADYYSENIICKPMDEALSIIEKIANVESNEHIYFFDDSHLNASAAIKRGWNVHHITKKNTILHLIPEIMESLKGEVKITNEE
ncbi:Pyrimidine 5'-nucleotidase [Spraguea lophii 42_110]|uniref:Pyrimidine 5'-nucleotidase n=1 Tax=Spraguea lophii (strain 42_110) TaxID=1358809 RepID=S7XLR3_SPRLO|nr:Pyrimidine 5'-nucleotidase [Spraguea lophii 42_110]